MDKFKEDEFVLTPESARATLGISDSATLDDAKTAYRAYARTYHPDINKDPDAEEQMKRGNLSFELIAKEIAAREETTQEDFDVAPDITNVQPQPETARTPYNSYASDARSRYTVNPAREKEAKFVRKSPSLDMEAFMGIINQLRLSQIANQFMQDLLVAFGTLDRGVVIDVLGNIENHLKNNPSNLKISEMLESSKSATVNPFETSLLLVSQVRKFIDAINNPQDNENQLNISNIFYSLKDSDLRASFMEFVIINNFIDITLEGFNHYIEDSGNSLNQAQDFISSAA